MGPLRGGAIGADLIYLVWTLAGWGGGALLLRSAWLGVRWWQTPSGPQRGPGGLAALFCAGLGAALLVSGLSLAGTDAQASPGGESAGSWSVPLVWPFMPFLAWACLACLAAAAASVAQGLLAFKPEESRSRTVAAALWLVAAAGAGAWFRMSGDSIEILRGQIQMRPPTVLALSALALAAVSAMAWTGRRAKERGWGKVVATHVALLAGSVVFGLPFAWLAITSFKEDRDMASPNGIVWVPRVQLTVPYRDPQDPLMQGDYQGQTVEGSIVERLPGERAKIDILKPLALRGLTFEAPLNALKEIPKKIPLVTGRYEGQRVLGKVVKEYDDGRRRVAVVQPAKLAGNVFDALPGDVEPYRKIGLRWQNYTDALDFLPLETYKGLVYLKNTLILVVLGVIGTILSCSIVAYAFSRMRFPGREPLFVLLLSTMMLPAAVTLLPQFLIFRWLGWIDTLYPLWVPAFFGGAFNVFLLRQFFMSVPMELEDAAKIDGCSYLKSYWSVMMPQVKPALAVIAIWTFMGAWNNFMGPLIYVNSPENMPIAYAVQLFQGDRGNEPGMLMAFTTLSMLPVLLLFFFAQRYFIEGVTLTGFGGR